MSTELAGPNVPMLLSRSTSWPGSYAVELAVVTARLTLTSTDHCSAVLVCDLNPPPSMSLSSCRVGSRLGLNSVMPNTPTHVGEANVPVLTSRYHLRTVVDAPSGTLVVA